MVDRLIEWLDSRHILARAAFCYVLGPVIFIAYCAVALGAAFAIWWLLNHFWALLL